MVANPDSWNTPTNLFKCFVVQFLLRCLAHAGYFEDSDAPEEDKSYIGEFTADLLARGYHWRTLTILTRFIQSYFEPTLDF